jgi:hypothetical protein
VYPSIAKVWADGAYAAIVQRSRDELNIDVEIIKKPPNMHTFKVLPRRWVVERTFGWFNRERRLSKDYERLPATTEAFIHITMVRLMTRRLARHESRLVCQTREPTPRLTIVVVPTAHPRRQPLPALLPAGQPLLPLLPARFDGNNQAVCC